MKGKSEVAKGLIVLANIAASSLVFGQLLNRPINWPALILGGLAPIAFYFAALILFNK